MARSSFVCSGVVFAIFASHLGACGSSPRSVAAPLSSLRGSSTVTISLQDNEIELSVLGNGNDIDACPELHATATMNGRPMQVASPGGYSAGITRNGCDGENDSNYQAPGCTAAVFSVDSQNEDTLTFVVTDESDTFHLVESGYAEPFTATLLTSSTLVPGETTSIKVAPTLAAATIGITMTPDQQLAVGPEQIQIVGNVLSFIVPAPDADADDASMDVDASADTVDAGDTCMMQHHPPCAEALVLNIDNVEPAPFSTCDGPSSCTPFGVEGGNVSVAVTYAP